MTFQEVFSTIRANCAEVAPEVASRVKEALLEPLSRGGSFPVPEEIFTALQRAGGGVSAHAAILSAIVESEPVTALRMLGLGNGPLFGREKATLSMLTVANQVGAGRLSSELEGLGPRRSLAKFFMGRQVAAHAYGQFVTAVRVASKLAEALGSTTGASEVASVSASIYFAPLLALALHSPSLYSALLLDLVNDSRDSIDARFQRLLALSPLECRDALLKANSLPKELGQILRAAEGFATKKPRSLTLRREGDNSGIALGLTAYLLEPVQRLQGGSELQSRIRDVAKACGLGEGKLRAIVSGAVRPRDASDVAGAIAESQSYMSAAVENREHVPPTLSEFLLELKATFKTKITRGEHHALPQALLCTTLALLKVFRFQRVFVLMVDERSRSLLPMLNFGEPWDDFSHSVRKLDHPNKEAMPDVQAVALGRAVFEGDPLVRDDWPFVSFPIRSQGVTCGVFYADRPADEEAAPLETADQVALIALGELWQQVPYEFACRNE